MNEIVYICTLFTSFSVSMVFEARTCLTIFKYLAVFAEFRKHSLKCCKMVQPDHISILNINSNRDFHWSLWVVCFSSIYSLLRVFGRFSSALFLCHILNSIMRSGNSTVEWREKNSMKNSIGTHFSYFIAPIMTCHLHKDTMAVIDAVIGRFFLFIFTQWLTNAIPVSEIANKFT